MDRETHPETEQSALFGICNVNYACCPLNVQVERLTLIYDVITGFYSQSIIQRNNGHGIHIASLLYYDILKHTKKQIMQDLLWWNIC